MEQNRPQYSIDYLNQIAPEQRRTFGGDKLFFIVIGIGLLLAVAFGIFMLVGSGGPNLTTQTQTVAAKLQTLETITKNADQKQAIKSNKLESINANLQTQLANANQKIVAPLEKNNISIDKLPKSVTDATAETDLQNKLEDARLNAIFDRVYSTNMSYQLKSLLLDMTTLSQKTNSDSLKSFISETKQNIEPIQKQLATFADQTE